MWLRLLLISLFCATGVVFSVNLPETCFSRIYCYGPLLHTVQMARIFNDSKTFVDMKMKLPKSEIFTNYEKLMQETQQHPNRMQVKKFVVDNFDEGNELDHWEPPDYKKSPKFLGRISDPVVRDFARHLIELWPQLARKIKPEVKLFRHMYSIIPVPNGFIVPGGRFREYYYWDSYWIIKGLLISEMDETARGMIDNFITLVKEYGFIPNGGRIYYLNRSQPPLLTKMALAYYKHTKNRQWLKENVEYLASELEFWLTNRTVTIPKVDKTYQLAHYRTTSKGPRPESYFEDTTTAQFKPDGAKEELYSDLKSGAESGWDFSSRWIFDEKGGNLANLTSIRTRRAVPVDLNAILCRSFNILAYFYSELNDLDNSNYWRKMGLAWQDAIKEILWDNDAGVWFDYDLELSRRRKYFYPSNLSPLWNECYDKHKSLIHGKRAIKYLNDAGVLETPGGFPTSIIETGEQWDFPNCWPPLQAMVVQGLRKTGEQEAVEQAKHLAFKWLKANIKGYRYTEEMFEKYDAVHPGKYGGGGEYIVQSGFGWTNGVALEMISDYFCNSDNDSQLN